jgi:glucoamylase
MLASTAWWTASRPSAAMSAWLACCSSLVLTGQDGFSPDQARGFAATPQEFQFGVCATASADPRCTVDPGTVPKTMDVLVPPGMDQADLLDYTVHRPVTLEAVRIP